MSSRGRGFRDAGVTFDRRTIHEQIGKGADMLVPALLPEANETDQKALAEAHGRIFKSRYLEEVRPFPGARDLLMRVDEADQKVVLASSASQAELDHYLDLLGVRDVVAASTSADDVKHTKPAPDIFATALKKVAPLSVGEVIVVGDMPYDIEAARKCGIAAIALRSGKFSDDAFEGAGAVAIYDHVAALLADYARSVLAG